MGMANHEFAIPVKSTGRWVKYRLRDVKFSRWLSETAPIGSR